MTRIGRPVSQGLIVIAAFAAAPNISMAQSLNDLACAAGVSCRGLPGNTPADVRMVYGIADEAAANKRFLEATRDYPDDVWHCAVTGQQCNRMSRDEARMAIPLAADTMAEAQTARRRAGIAQSGPEIIEVEPVAKRDRGPPVEIVENGDAPGGRGGGSHGGDIQPRDGFWTASAGTPQLSGCPRQLAGMLAGQAPQTGGSQQVSFKRPFHPSQLVPMSGVEWRRTGSNQWSGELASTRGQTAQVRWTMHVVSPDRIDGTNTVEMRVTGVCRSVTPTRFQRG